VALVPCDAGVFVSQAAGEYEERLQSVGLTLVTELADEPLRINADSRRMWRVFDNLMNNACKYSQPGTRVFLSLYRVGNEATFTFKNTSREELNISAEELTERFVRGDSSRGTDGNGLGLSIAKSLTELQGGRLTLAIDGDLFKATLHFPLI
jgi:signal transduction histidine kinase